MRDCVLSMTSRSHLVIDLLRIAHGYQSVLMSYDLSLRVFIQFEHQFKSNGFSTRWWIHQHPCLIYFLLSFLHPWLTSKHPLLMPHHSFPSLLSLIGIIIDRSPLDHYHY